MSDTDTPMFGRLSTRRAFSFSLRTLFVSVTIVSLWLGYSLHWIRSRHAFINDHGISMRDVNVIRAPLSLWILGESGLKSISLSENGDRQEHVATIEQAKRLFPEAVVVVDFDGQLQFLRVTAPEASP